MTVTKILVVEDERIVAESLRKRLRSLHYEVPAVLASGEEAVEEVGRLQPNLVLMDISLAGEMDGIEAAQKIRTQHHLPVVYLTAYSNSEVLERAKVTEPFGFILKPYEDRELHVVIETALFKHRMEAERRNRERWLAAILASIGDGVVATDVAGRVTFLNEEAERLTGWKNGDAQNMEAQEVLQLVHETTRSPVEAPLIQAMKQRIPVPLHDRTILISKDHSERPLDDAATPIIDEEGVTLGGVMVFRDITERRRLEEQLRQSHKMEAIGRLAGGIAHDFNNLLTVINGYSSMLLDMLPSHRQATEAIKQIHQAGQRAADLTSQLLAYSRKSIRSPHVIELNGLLLNAQKMLSRIIGENNRVELINTQQPCHVQMDPIQVERVLINLAANARDAMPQGGVFTIKLTPSVTLASNTGFSEVDGSLHALLEISDTGSGMSAETMSHLFEPFHTTKEHGKGTGLGLAMVYGIVTQSGGSINVTSELGRGTRFQILLPQMPEPVSAATEVRPHHAPLGGGETILLIEDEQAIRLLEQSILHRQGYTVLEAGSGPAGVQILREYLGNIDLVVMDVVMPGLSGQSLANAIASVRPNVKMMFVSGHADDELVRRGIEHSGFGFLQKPFGVNQFASKVREVLDRDNNPERSV